MPERDQRISLETILCALSTPSLLPLSEEEELLLKACAGKYHQFCLHGRTKSHSGTRWRHCTEPTAARELRLQVNISVPSFSGLSLCTRSVTLPLLARLCLPSFAGPIRQDQQWVPLCFSPWYWALFTVDFENTFLWTQLCPPKIRMLKSYLQYQYVTILGNRSLKG